MKNLEIKERFNKVKQDIENGKLYLEKYIKNWKNIKLRG